MILWNVSFCLQIEFLKEILLWGTQIFRFSTWCPSVQFFAPKNNYFKHSLVPFVMHWNRIASRGDRTSSLKHLKLDESENSQISSDFCLISISMLYLTASCCSKDTMYSISLNYLILISEMLAKVFQMTK